MKRFVGIVVAMALTTPASAFAFYSHYGDSLELDLTGNVRVNDTAGRFRIDGLPEFIGTDLNIVGTIGRVMGTAIVGENLSFEAHVYALASGQAVSPFLAGIATADGFGFTEDGRWGALSHRPYDRSGTFAELAVDRANVRLNVSRLELTLGRQPINLATTSFFTPNDFWQPFTAQTFFRVYKPGVDSARAEIELGSFTRLSLIGVLGFDHGREPAYDDPITIAQSSALGRFQTVVGDLELAVLGGKAPQRWVVGGSVQGELFASIGLRAEGHYAIPYDDGDGALELAVGIERRFESSLFLQGEYFFHGAGAADPDGYAGRLTDPVFLAGPRYLGRHYAAVAAGYELDPLTNGSLLFLVNASDGSFLSAVYLVRSLDDESEVSLVASVPIGKAPSLTAIESENGAAPITVGVEFRSYF